MNGLYPWEGPYDDLFGGHDDLIAVDAGTGSYRYAMRYRVDRHFPLLQPHMHHHGCIDLRVLAMELQSELTFPYIAFDQIIKSLRNLFGQLRKHSSMTEGLSTGVFRTLDRYLEIDLYEPHRNAGHRRCRNHFRLLALFARLTGSTTLASALASFFCVQAHEVTRHERDVYLRDWMAAIVYLQDLLSPSDFNTCMSYFYPRGTRMLTAYHRSGHQDPRLDMLFNFMLSLMNDRNHDYDYDFHRGRHRYLMPVDPFHIPRAKTVPPHMRLMDYSPRHSFQPLLLPPTAPAMLMPAPSSGFNDVQALEKNQYHINQRLHHLQHDVEMQNHDLMRFS